MTSLIRAKQQADAVHQAAGLLNQAIRDAFEDGIETVLDTQAFTNQHGTTCIVVVESTLVNPHNLDD